MADGVNIPITVQTLGDKGAAAADGLAKVQQAAEAAAAAGQKNAEATEAQAAAQSSLNDAIRARPASAADAAYGAQMSADAASALNNGASPDEIATAEQLAAIENQRASIAFQISEARRLETLSLQAQVAGETEESAMLQREVVVREEAVTLMRQLGVEEAEALAMARERVTLEAEVTAQKQAQAVAEKEQAASSKVYGRGGRAGQLAQNFGADSNTAASIGLGVFAGVAAESAINGMIEKIEEESRAMARLSDETAKQAENWRRSAISANSMSDVASLVNQMDGAMQKLNAQIEQNPILGKGIEGTIDKLKSWAQAAMNPDLAMPDYLKTSGEKQGEELERQRQKMETTFVATFKAAQREANEFKSILDGPLDQAAEKLGEKIAKIGEAMSHQNMDTVAGITTWAQLQAQAERYSDALDKVNKQIERQKDEEERANAERQKADQHAAEMLQKTQEQLEIEQALADGDEKKAKALENQLRLQDELNKLEAAGADPQAESNARKTAELRDQVEAKREQARLDAEAAQTAKEQADYDREARIEHDKATGNKRDLAAAERAEFEARKKQELEGAGFSGDDYQKRLDQSLKDYDREHRRRGVIGGPTTRAPGDTLGDVESDSDFDAQFGKHVDVNAESEKAARDLNPRHPDAPLSKLNNIPDNLGDNASKDFQNLHGGTQQYGPPAPKAGEDGGAAKLDSAGSKLDTAGSKLDGAGGKLDSSGEKLSSAAQAMQQAAQAIQQAAAQLAASAPNTDSGSMTS